MLVFLLTGTLSLPTKRTAHPLAAAEKPVARTNAEYWAQGHTQGLASVPQGAGRVLSGAAWQGRPASH